MITLKPTLEAKVGSYSNAAVRFSYRDYPDLHYDFTILSIIDDCIVEEASFSPSLLRVDQYLSKQE